MLHSYIMGLLTTQRTVTRISAHVFFAGFVWPLVTVLGAWVSLVWLPYYSVLPESAVAYALGGRALISGDMFVTVSLEFQDVVEIR